VRRFTFFALINAAPASAGHVHELALAVARSATNENMYLLDGTDFTAPLTGAAWPWPNTDAIEEVQVLSLGAPADYGNLAGAVFNVVTRQGSNQFHGDLNFYYQNQSLTGRNTTDDQDDGLPYNRTQFRDSTVQLGGPLMKDKFWFFGSFQYQKDSDSQPGTDPDFPAASSAKRYFWKLNYQINGNNRLQAQMHDDSSAACHRERLAGIGALKWPQPVARLPVVVGAHATTVLEARYSGFYGGTTAIRSTAARAWRVVTTTSAAPAASTAGTTARARRRPSRARSQIRRQLHGWQPRLQGRRAVQLRSRRAHLRQQRLHHTYSGVPAYGYTQLPWTWGGRLRLRRFADDTYKLGRATFNVGVASTRARLYFVEQDFLDRNGDPTGQKSRAVDRSVHVERHSPRFGMNLKLNKSGATLLKGPTAATTRHRHRRVRQHHAVDHAEVCVLG
jgi:hypothetical protein